MTQPFIYYTDTKRTSVVTVPSFAESRRRQVRRQFPKVWLSTVTEGEPTRRFFPKCEDTRTSNSIEYIGDSLEDFINARQAALLTVGDVPSVDERTETAAWVIRKNPLLKNHLTTTITAIMLNDAAAMPLSVNCHTPLWVAFIEQVLRICDLSVDAAAYVLGRFSLSYTEFSDAELESLVAAFREMNAADIMEAAELVAEKGIGFDGEVQPGFPVAITRAVIYVVIPVWRKAFDFDTFLYARALFDGGLTTRGEHAEWLDENAEALRALTDDGGNPIHELWMALVEG